MSIFEEVSMRGRKHRKSLQTQEWARADDGCRMLIWQTVKWNEFLLYGYPADAPGRQVRSVRQTYARVRLQDYGSWLHWPAAENKWGLWPSCTAWVIAREVLLVVRYRFTKYGVCRSDRGSGTRREKVFGGLYREHGKAIMITIWRKT